MKIGNFLTLHKDIIVKTSTIAIILATFWYDGWQYFLLHSQNIELVKQLEVQEQIISLAQKKIVDVKNQNATITTALQNEQATNQAFQTQIQNIAGTVGVLEKLSQTDSELLKKYSKVYFLNENYVPKTLTNIPEKYLYEKNRPLQIQTGVWPHLQTMLESAQADGVIIQIVSAYRSFGTQAGLKSSYKVTYGAGTANAFSADQGYSEHQLGTTLDFTTPELGANFVGFEKTTAYTWLTANAYRYGFILSYPKDNAFYKFEPWHFRFVSRSLSGVLHTENLVFYDVDQRNIDGYLVNFFD